MSLIDSFIHSYPRCLSKTCLSEDFWCLRSRTKVPLVYVTEMFLSRVSVSTPGHRTLPPSLGASIIYLWACANTGSTTKGYRRSSQSMRKHTAFHVRSHRRPQHTKNSFPKLKMNNMCARSLTLTMINTCTLNALP